MNGCRDSSIGSRLARGLRPKRLVGASALALTMTLVAAACGSTAKVPGVASIVASATAAVGSTIGSPTGAGAQVGWLAYAQCMRAHGVRDFPDPNSQGQLNVHSGGDLDPNSPIYRAADTACASLSPVNNLSPAQRAQVKAANLKYAQCMRAHGIADFPDPNAEGAISLHAHPGSDLEPNNPTFQAAQTACKALRPGGANSGGS